MVRLRYVYKDGHEFITETMHRADAVVYMTLLKAVATTPDRWTAPFGVIYFEEV